jgi:peptidyl-prolyl cis-trans isomerase SurA
MAKKLRLLPVVFLLLAGGLHADNIVDEIVARVNDSIITHADVQKGAQQAQDELKERFPSDWQVKWTERQKDVLRDLIDRQLLLDKGKSLGITGETETVKRLNEIRQQMGLGSMEDLEKAARQQGVSFEDFKEQTRETIVTERVIGQQVGAYISDHISEDEIQKWYNDHQKDLAIPESVKLGEILVSTQSVKPGDEGKSGQNVLPEDPERVAAAQAKANDVLQQLHQGAKFEDLAKQYSEGPTAAQGGELGEFKRGELAKELEEKTFALKVGDVSDVIRTRQGFLIFKVLQHQQAGVPALKDVSEKIRGVLYLEKLEPRARSFLTKLREQAYIEIHEGFVDSGASPNQVKPVLVAANTKDDETKQIKNKKKKRFLVF